MCVCFTSYPHALGKCGGHRRRWIDQRGRNLLLCANGGGPIHVHDGVAFALAHLAPPGPSSEYPGAVRHATAVHAAIARWQQSLAPGATWRVTDLAAYGDVFADVAITHPASPALLRRAPALCDGRSCVLNALYGAVAKKLKHYERELAPAGPFAPGKGKFVPFVASDRGLLAPAASKLLKDFALKRTCVAGGGDGDPRSPASKAFRANGARLISTVIQRWTACTLHAAATEFFELNNPPAAPWPDDVDAPHFLRFLGPGPATRDLSSHPDLELADIDAVGLQPVESLLG